MDLDLIIRNADVATALERWRGDIGIKDGRIVLLGERLRLAAAREIDAGGRLVLPGGVDGHCHIDQQTSQGLTTADDFYSGTVSAAFGGTTTIIPFAAQKKGQSLRVAVEDYRKRAEGKAVVDYAIHLIVTDPTAQVLGQELPALVHDGYTSLKIYMTYQALRLDDRQVMDVLATARREGAMVMVHAESHDIISWLTDRLIDGARTAPKYHAQARPAPTEREATHRAITMAELLDLPILIVHVASEAAADEIARAQARGLRIHAETCPQYLFLTASDLDRENFEGAKYVCTPPLRTPRDQEALWQALRRGVFQVFSSDHSAFRFDDPKGKLASGRDAPFNRIPQGMPGLEARLPLLFSEGVGKGRLTLQQFVSLTATAPAALYGLAGVKGTIAVGADADLVIWDAEREVEIACETLHDNVDYTPYEGMRVTGWPATVLSRGEIVCEGGELRAPAGRGRFLPCARPEPARPSLEI